MNTEMSSFTLKLSHPFYDTGNETFQIESEKVVVKTEHDTSGNTTPEINDPSLSSSSNDIQTMESPIQLLAQLSALAAKINPNESESVDKFSQLYKRQKTQRDLGNYVAMDSKDLYEYTEGGIRNVNSSEIESNWSALSNYIEEECKNIDQHETDRVSSSHYADGSNSDNDYSYGDEEEDDESDNPITTVSSSGIIKDKTRLSKGKWSPEEDKLLLKLIDNKSHPTWKHIAAEFPTRNAKQCRDRWLYHLSPDVNKDEFSEIEDEKLIQYHKMYGNRWHDICTLIGNGRHVNMIRSRILLLLRRQRKLALKAAKKRSTRSSSIQNIISLNNQQTVEKVKSGNSSDVKNLDFSSLKSPVSTNEVGTKGDGASVMSAITTKLDTTSRRSPLAKIYRNDKSGLDSVFRNENIGGPVSSSFPPFHPAVPVVPQIFQTPGASFPPYFYPPPYSAPYYPTHHYVPYIPTTYLQHPYYADVFSNPSQLLHPSSLPSQASGSGELCIDDQLGEVSIHELYKRRDIIDAYIMQHQGQYRTLGLKSNVGVVDNVSPSLVTASSPNHEISVKSQLISELT